MDLSIIIVTYNHEEEIIPCLEAIINSRGAFTGEIIIVDNQSQDKTVRRTVDKIESNPNPDWQIQLIQSPLNTGFTSGTNTGLRQCQGEYILLLNPDTLVTPHALTQMMSFLKENPKTGIAAPQLLFPDGKIQPSCRRFPRRRDILWHLLGLHALFPRSRIFNHWKMGGFEHCKTTLVDQPQGAALMTHRNAFKEIGLLDEAFPMFFSDVDWCQRFKNSGWEIIFYPGAKVYHLQGTSIHRHRIPMIWSSHQSFLKYFQKYNPGSVNQLINGVTGLLLFLSALLRIGVTFLRFQFQRFAHLKNSGK